MLELKPGPHSCYVVAVSGGVDSVVLLDVLAKGNRARHGLQGEEQSLEFTSKDLAEGLAPPRIIIAHFDHGIRPASADDALFVESLAKKYGLAYETKREELGPNASEELARNRRYGFLRDVAKKHDATIVTAHHADDMVETIAINLTRGTGWRGLAVLDSPDILRPLIGHTKAELYDYAKMHDLQWREDATNSNTNYLRNDMRRRLSDLDSQTKELLRLYRDRQVALRKMIDTEIDTYTQKPYSRYFFANVPDKVAVELLRGVLIKEIGESPVRPQLTRALQAVKTYQTGKHFTIDATHVLRFSRSDFVVATRSSVVS